MSTYYFLKLVMIFCESNLNFVDQRVRCGEAYTMELMSGHSQYKSTVRKCFMKEDWKARSLEIKK